MNEKKTKYIKLVRMLIASDKKISFILVLSVIIGFTFLFTVTSLSESIIKTKQDNTVETYGKFLVVIPELDRESEKNIKSKCSQFAFEHYSVLGNIEYANREITIGTMEENMGENLAFQLMEGKWPQTSDQIVVEEYLLHLFGIENEKLPCSVSLQNEGKTVKFEITGVISNYSYLLSTPSKGGLETKVYPSVICGQEETQNVKRSLVILQKKLNIRNVENDINTLLTEISEENMSINEKLYGQGYQDFEDMRYIKVIYLVILNFLLLLEQIVVIRSFLLRNRKTLFLFEALGMSQKNKRKTIFFLILGFICVGFIMGYLLAVLIGFLYINYMFREFGGYYIYALHHSILVEGIVVIAILAGLYFFFDLIREESIIWGINSDTAKKQKKYKFKRIDFGIVMLQTICIFFTMFSFYSMNAFQGESEEINFDLYSKQTAVSYPLKEYNIAVYGNDFFSFDVLDVFEEYKDYVSISAEAETKQSTILLEKDNIDSYMKQYSGNNDGQLRSEDKGLWKQIANKAEAYQAIPINDVKIIVLPKKEYHLFLKKKGIDNSVLEQNVERMCVICLPDYRQIPLNPSIKENGMVQLGSIRGSEIKVEFYLESFKVGSVISGNGEECSAIQVIMSEEAARKSKTVLGYDTIRVVMKNDTPLSIQHEVEEKVLLLMASTQGGMLDSSGMRNQRDQLMRNYISVMSNTMLFFCIIVIVIYIILSIYIDWEKYSYEYGVLRSFGMSYAALQHKLFIRYSNSILIACIFCCFMGRYTFTEELLPIHILISIGITVGATFLCRIWVFCKKKKQSISSLLNKG